MLNIVNYCVCVCSVAQLCPIFCDPMDCSPPGTPVHGIFQSRILEQVAISSFKGSFQPRDQSCVSCISCMGKCILYHCTSWETQLIIAAAAAAKSLQSCLTLWDPIDSSPPGSPVPGISRQEHWSGFPFPSPMHEGEKWKWSRSVMSNSSRPYGLQPTRLLRPWDFPGKSTGVGCHCLLRWLSSDN